MENRAHTLVAACRGARIALLGLLVGVALAALIGGCEPSSYDPCPSTVVSGGSCSYRGYGTTCPVPCNFEPSCVYTVGVTWSGGGYCCASPSESYTGCRCEGGETVCDIYLSGPTRSPPTTTCELCPRDMGVPVIDL